MFDSEIGTCVKCGKPTPQRLLKCYPTDGVLKFCPGCLNLLTGLQDHPDEESHVQLIQACNIQPESIVWLWDGWLPCGKLVILAGQPGTGKTTVTLSVIAAVTAGGRLPDGSTAEIGSVVIWSGEDGVADTLVPRLIAMGADMTKVYFVSGKGHSVFDPSKDLPLLSQQIKQIPDVKLVLIDPVVSVIAGDSHKNAEVRRGLQPLVDLGNETGACIVGISHFNKSGGNTSTPIDLISGSIAFAAVARVVLGAAKLATPDEEHGHSRIFCRIKSNIGPDEDGVGYDLRMEPLAGYAGIQASTVLWGAYVQGHSRDLLAQPSSNDGSGTNSRSSEAVEFLRSMLAGGAVAQKTVEEEASQVGISKRTLVRAKATLRVVSRKGVGGWLWEIVEDDQGCQVQGCQTSTTKKLGTLGTLGNVAKDAKLGTLGTLEGNGIIEGLILVKDAKDAKDAKISGDESWHSCQESDPFDFLDEVTP